MPAYTETSVNNNVDKSELDKPEVDLIETNTQLNQAKNTANIRKVSMKPSSSFYDKPNDDTNGQVQHHKSTDKSAYSDSSVQDKKEHNEEHPISSKEAHFRHIFNIFHRSDPLIEKYAIIHSQNEDLKANNAKL
ncbi:hypothetical protein K501DRAFT_273210, partial [Backusella circina FSU 941]